MWGNCKPTRRWWHNDFYPKVQWFAIHLIPIEGSPRLPQILLLVVSTQAHSTKGSAHTTALPLQSSQTTWFSSHLSLLVVALRELPRGENNTPHNIQSIRGGNNHKEPLKDSRQHQAGETRNPWPQRLPSATKWKSQMHTLGLSSSHTK
jgi:hypothetical protein